MKTPQQIDKEREREEAHCLRVAREILTTLVTKEQIAKVILRERREAVEAVLQQLDEADLKPEFKPS